MNLHSSWLSHENDETIRAYDAIHELYDAETIDFWEKFPDETIKVFVDKLPGKNVLDVGSGPGRDALIIREHGLNVTCLDGSEKMVQMTSRLGFHSIQNDIRNFQLEDSSFHGIWAYSSLIHISFLEARNFVLNAMEILKPGGLLFLGLIHGVGNENRNVAGSSFVRYFEYYDHDKIMSLMDNTSFKLVFNNTFRPGNHTYLNYIFRR